MIAIEQLKDKNFLYDLYVIKKIPGTKIGNMIGCSKATVYSALKKFNLIEKTEQKTEALKKQLENKNWLIDQYKNKEKTATEIVKQFNIKGSTYAIKLIRDSLSKFGIVKHSRRYLRIKNNSKDYFEPIKDIIDGCLLGDAGLWIPNNKEESAPFFRKSNRYKDHVFWVANKLFLKNSEKRIKVRYTKLNEKYFKAYRFDSLTHDFLSFYYKRWYPKENSYKKVIPRDCSISPIALLNWFLDDGSTTYEKCKKVVRLTFCTDSFSKFDQEILSKRIYKRYGLILYVRKYRKNIYRMFLCGSQIEKFYHIIGECPVKSLSYKWKYPKRTIRKIINKTLVTYLI